MKLKGLNWLQKETYEFAERKARKFYFENLAGQTITSSALKETVRFTDEGWNHFTVKSRSLNELILRFFVLPRVATVLSQGYKKDYRKITKAKMVVEYWELRAVVEHVFCRAVVCSINHGEKFFLSCGWLGTKDETGIISAKKELSLSPHNDKASVLGRPRRMATSQLSNKKSLYQKNKNVKMVDEKLK